MISILLIILIFTKLVLIYIFFKYINIYKFICNNYIYNQSWEDPLIDKEIYDLKINNKILMITTGGDNVLNYLINEPDFIHTIDFNKYQNYLLQIKIAIIKTLDWDDVIQILCYNNYKIFEDNFPLISDNLTYDCKIWWNTNKIIMKNFHYSGYVKYFAYSCKFLIYITGLTNYINELKNCDFETQQKLYIKYKSKLQFIGNMLYTFSDLLAPFIGVPTEQKNMSNLHCNEWLERILYTQPFKNNYFYYSYLYGHWTTECCPDYLKYKYFNIVKNNLHKIHIYTDKLQNITNYIDNTIKYDRVIMLDHMDWMNNDQIADEWNSIIPFTDTNCKFCWKSFSFTQPFAVLNNIDYHVSTHIFPKYKDRVGMYNSIHVASVKKSLNKLNIPKYSLSYYNKIKVFLYTIILPLINIFQKNEKKFMDNYYKYQVKFYDAYRFKLLHGKLPMLYTIDFKPNSDILIVAGGTGDILEYIKDYVDQSNKITIIDICDHMIDEANLRVKKYGWKNVECICQNALHINTNIKYDLVIISYSLSMIPVWKQVIDISIDCLKSNSQLAVADFTFNDKQYTITKHIFNFIFSFSYINVDKEHIKYLQNKLKTKFLRYDTGSFPNLPGIYCPYYYALFTN
tara:strand:+ start:2423 stop:4300 length:1878 start_codon:yes stop_codon:yes gene_type:complete